MPSFVVLTSHVAEPKRKLTSELPGCSTPRTAVRLVLELALIMSRSLAAPPFIVFAELSEMNGE
jgi:hypothetical protein